VPRRLEERLRKRDVLKRDPNSALMRVLYSAIAGVNAGIFARSQGRAFALLAGWNAAGLVLLALSWVVIWRSTPATTHRRAAAEDPGRTLVYVFVIVAATVGFFAAILLSRDLKTLPAIKARWLCVLCLSTVTLSWALLQTIFTLRYGHLYYREDAEGVGGVEFPGKHKPSYFDFAYFAFTIGMCFQTSDVCVTSPQIRRGVLLQAIISFAYNTAILAFVLNLVFGQV
jgi:uncharacterized membrane protein